MTGSPLDMIGLVNAAAGATRLAGRAVSSLAEGTPFADLLGQARTGAVPSGLPVTVSDAAGLELTNEQLARLATAADRAAAQGAETAVVMIDGSAYRLDVESRQITGRVDEQAGMEQDVDAFLFAPPAESGGAPVGPPAGGVRNPDLLRMLGERGGSS